jgi:hypothetical protein
MDYLQQKRNPYLNLLTFQLQECTLYQIQVKRFKIQTQKEHCTLHLKEYSKTPFIF